MIFTTRYESKPKPTVWNCSNFLKKASVAKLYSGIRRYFVKKREIGLF